MNFDKFMRIYMFGGKGKELGLSASQMLLLAAIAFQQDNNNGVCVSSNRELGTMVNLGKDRVDHLITSLKRAGVLDVKSSKSKMSVVIDDKEQMVYRTIKINF